MSSTECCWLEIKPGWCLSSFHTVETTKTECKPSLAQWLSCALIELALLRRDWQRLRISLVLSGLLLSPSCTSKKWNCHWHPNIKWHQVISKGNTIWCSRVTWKERGQCKTLRSGEFISLFQVNWGKNWVECKILPECLLQPSVGHLPWYILPIITLLSCITYLSTLA